MSRERRTAKLVERRSAGQRDVQSTRASAFALQAVGEVYNLIRGCNPAPGAWAMHGDTELSIFDCRLGDALDGEPGSVIGTGEDDLVIALNGGSLRVQRVRPKGGKKVTSAEYAAESGLAVGDRLT